MIKSVTLRNWKGISRTVELDRLTLLHGPNGCGKSAIMQAIRWCIAGDCELGKRADIAAAYCSDTSAYVSIQFGDGTSMIVKAYSGADETDFSMVHVAR